MFMQIIQGKVVWFEPDNPACCFRAFPTLDAGALDYLQTLHRRFQSAWPAVVAGDPARFSHLLKRSRYYTADEAQYTKTLVALFREFSRTLPLGGAAKPLPNLYTTEGIQHALKELGFDPGKLDGIDGPNTQGAIIAFQLAKGLLPDGIVGRFTRAALTRAWAELDDSLT